MTHIVLLLLIAGKNTDLADVSMEESVKYRVTETSCSTSYH